MNQHHGTIPTIHAPAEQARARGSGLTAEQRQAGQMHQQQMPQQPPHVPQMPYQPPRVPQMVHIMGRGEPIIFQPPLRPTQIRGDRSRSAPVPAQQQDVDLDALFGGGELVPEAPRPSSNRKAPRSRSNRGNRRYTSEDHRVAEAPQGTRVPPTAGPEPVGASAQRRRGLGIAPAAPVAPKMEAKQEDTNTRLGYPRGLPAPPGPPPKAKAVPNPPPAKAASPTPPPKSKAKATPTAKKSAPPAPAPPDHGGAAVAIRSVPKAPMRPDDTRRMLDRSRLSGALSDAALPSRRHQSAPPAPPMPMRRAPSAPPMPGSAPMRPDDKRRKLNRNTLAPATRRGRS